MLSLDTINAIRTLLNRTDIKGGEVSAFNRIITELADEERLASQSNWLPSMAPPMPFPFPDPSNFAVGNDLHVTEPTPE